MNVAEAKNEKYILYMYQLFYKISQQNFKLNH